MDKKTVKQANAQNGRLKNPDGYRRQTGNHRYSSDNQSAFYVQSANGNFNFRRWNVRQKHLQLPCSRVPCVTSGRTLRWLFAWVDRCLEKLSPRYCSFAPAVSMEQFDCGFDALQMFARLEGVNEDTIVRGFCTMPEQRMGDLLPSSL